MMDATGAIIGVGAIAAALLVAMLAAWLHPAARAAVGRAWRGLSYVASALGALAVVGAVTAYAALRRRPVRRSEPDAPAHEAEAEAQRAEARAIEAEARAEAAEAAHDTDPEAGWGELDAIRDELRERRR